MSGTVIGGGGAGVSMSASLGSYQPCPCLGADRGRRSGSVHVCQSGFISTVSVSGTLIGGGGVGVSMSASLGLYQPCPCLGR